MNSSRFHKKGWDALKRKKTGVTKYTAVDIVSPDGNLLFFAEINRTKHILCINWSGKEKKAMNCLHFVVVVVVAWESAQQQC